MKSKVFDFEIFVVSQCLSLNTEELYHGSKSDLLIRFDTSQKPCISTNDSSIIIELNILIKSNAHINVTTFNDYASFILKKIVGIANDFSGIDVIADRYF